MTKKYGIMGGTFDPVHCGHLAIANDAAAILNLEKVIFIPAGIPPHKIKLNITSKEDRYSMTKSAIENNPVFSISDMEINSEKINYTSDTLKELKRMYPDVELYFIIGTDSLIDLPKWHKPEEIVSLCKIVIVERPGYYEGKYNREIEAATEKYGDRLKFIKGPHLYISSTELRERIKNNMPVKYMVPDSVEEYIENKKLYR